MEHRDVRPAGSSLGAALEVAVKWALPASPLFLAVLMVLAHAPYASPIVSPSLFYLACMLGAFLGIGLCAIPARPSGAVLVAACVAGGVTLEVAWLVLLAAERMRSAPLLLAGSALAGLGTAVLLVLWLWVGQTDSLTCEIAKLAGVFAISYVLYTLFSVIPHAGVVSYLFPVITCVPLSVAVRRQAALPVGVERPAPHPGPARTLFTGAVLATFGAGFAALGFGGERVEQGAGLLAQVLVACLMVTPGKIELLRVSSVPLVVFSLCYAALAGPGNAFAFFLAGCGSLVVWLFEQHRFGWGRPRLATLRAVALRLAFIGLCAGVGMSLGHLAFQAFEIVGSPRLFTLVAAVVGADFLWRVAGLADDARADRRALAAMDGDVPLGDAFPASLDDGTRAGAASAWAAVAGGASADACRRPAPAGFCEQMGLSPREGQVAELLCQGRSVSYISNELGMAPSTTKTHVRHVYEKAGVHSRTEFQQAVERECERDGEA